MLVDVYRKNVKATIVNIETTLAKRNIWLPTSHSPITTNSHPSEDVSNNLNVRGVQAYHELIGEIQWAV